MNGYAFIPYSLICLTAGEMLRMNLLNEFSFCTVQSAAHIADFLLFANHPIRPCFKTPPSRLLMADCSIPQPVVMKPSQPLGSLTSPALFFFPETCCCDYQFCVFRLLPPQTPSHHTSVGLYSGLSLH